MDPSKSERRQYYRQPVVAGQAYDHASGNGVEEGVVSAADYFNDPAAGFVKGAIAGPNPRTYGDSDLGPNPDEYTQRWTEDDGKAKLQNEEKREMMRVYMESGLKLPRMDVEEEVTVGCKDLAEGKRSDTRKGPDVEHVINRAAQASQKLDAAMRKERVKNLVTDQQQSVSEAEVLEAQVRLDEQRRLVEQMQELQRRNMSLAETSRRRVEGSGGSNTDDDGEGDPVVEQWLGALDLEECRRSFRTEGIDVDVLSRLSVEQLGELGVRRLGEQVKLQTYARQVCALRCQ